MKKTLKKRGQKIAKRVVKFSHYAGKKSKAHLKENLIQRVPRIRHIRLLMLEWSLLVFAIIFLAIAQASWYSDSYATVSYSAGGSFTEATLGEVKSLNPLFASSNSEKALSKLMFSTLTNADYSGHTGYGLAKSIKSDPSNTVWTLQLRDHLKWSDGTPLTNRDIMYTVKVIQDPAVKTIYSSNLTKVKVAEKDHKIVFTLPSAYANFPTALNFPILPAHILEKISPELLAEHDFSANLVSSGAFTYNAVQSVGNEGEKIVYLSANPNYYKGEPLLSSFIVHAFLSVDDIKKSLQSGSISGTAELSASDGQDLSSDINERRSAINSGVFAFLNTSSNTLKSKSLRKSIQKGISLTKLRADLNGEQAINSPILPSQIELPEAPVLPKRQVNLAKQEIAKLSIKEPLRIATVSTGYLPKLADTLKSQLAKIGLKSEVTIFSPGQEFFFGVIRPRAYDILIYEVDLGADPDLLAYYHSSQTSENGLNLSNYNNAIVDDLILAARSTPDRKLQLAKYRSFAKYWIDDVPAIGIYQSNMSYFSAKSARIFSEDNRLAHPIDRFYDVETWAIQKSSKNRTP